MTKFVGLRIVRRAPQIEGHFVLFYIWNDYVVLIVTPNSNSVILFQSTRTLRNAQMD